VLILLPPSEPAVGLGMSGSYAAVLAVAAAPDRAVLWAAARDSLQRAAARDSVRRVEARAAARLVALADDVAALRDSAASRDAVARAESPPALGGVPVVESGVVPAVAPAVAPARARRLVPTARILGRPARAGVSPVRLELSLADLTLVALQGDDTLLVAAAGVGTGDSLRFGTRVWRFATPVGRRVVLGKQAAPVWVPPEWHYAGLAAARGYTLRHLRAGRAEPLGGGRRLIVRGGRVGVVNRAGAFTPAPTDNELVFGNTLYVPPFGTENRRVPGQLGAYRLDLGDGYLIHGTPDETTVGTPSSHGCVRLAGDALAWVYAHVPVGAAVVVR
jgi:hypothetical protein